MGFVVEPYLGKDKLTVVMDYPASQAALAAVEEKQGEYVAKRFEVYYQGIELGNGYLELTDADQQEQRLRQANEKRMAKGRESLPLDCHFIAALQKGMPPCCGVAVGFDRLLQLH
jgi:lysyl-tRNA synthetase class 2